MNSLTLFFALPAGVFLFVAGLFYINRSLPRGMALLPLLACYGCAAFILLSGGCHNVAHVTLEGLEADLVDAEGQARDVVIGGEAEKGQPSGIEVPGYPVDALRVRYDKDAGNLVIRPGPGYHRGLLVRSDQHLVPLEPSGLPRLVSLQAGDTLRVAPEEGGEVLAQWKLGTGKYDLNLDAASYRWIGGADKGIAHLPGMPGQVIGLRAEGSTLFIKKGSGFTSGLGVMLNGRRLKLGGTEEIKANFQMDATLFALVGPDPALGVFTLQESGFQRFNAALHWTSLQQDKPVAHPFEMETSRVYRIGGAIEDDFVVKGLPPGVLTLGISEAGEMTLDLTDAGRKLVSERKLGGAYPQTCKEVNHAVRVGLDSDAAGGQFLLLGPAQPALMAAAAPADPDAESENIEVDAAPPAPAASLRWKCAWLPNPKVVLPLENREIVLPLINTNVSLGTRRPWTQRVFPLSNVTPMASGLRSLIVYGQKHDQFAFNGANLLQFEPGITVERAGSAVDSRAVNVGVLSKTGRLEFLQVMADEQGETHGVALGSPLHPARIWDARRVSLRKRFAAFTIVTRVEGSGRHERKIPVLKVSFEKPVIRSIPLGEVKNDLSARADGPTDIKFAINDRGGFSTLQHQVLFPGLSRWFDASADIQLNWMSLDIQDDYRLQPSASYETPFKIGSDRRLILRVTKHSVPWSNMAIMLVTGLAACALCLWHGAGFSWMSLFFGAAYLTCARVLFGQAALVNPPFNEDILRHAMQALILTPVVLGIGGHLLRGVLPGRVEKRLRALEHWIGYGKLMALAVLGLVVRILLLGLGFKEAIAIGSTRIALSIGFVPLYLLLFALCFFVLWRGKQGGRTLGWPQVWPFIRCALVLSLCQTATAVLVSDLGIMLYFIPQALVLAVIGGIAGTQSLLAWLREDPAGPHRRQGLVFAILSGVLPMIPLLAMAVLFTSPQAVLGLVPGLKAKITADEQAADGDIDLVTDSTLLRVLQFTNREYLINLGTDTSERIAQDHAIMENYAHRGLFGEGYLKVEVLPAKFVTAMNDNVSAVYIFAQFGVLGALAVLVAYLAISLATGGALGRHDSFTAWLALVAGISFSLVSLYMMAANFGLLPFTGRNMYLLGLNSLSDVVESLVLLLFIVLGLVRSEFHEQQESVDNAAGIGLGELIGKPSRD